MTSRAQHIAALPLDLPYREVCASCVSAGFPEPSSQAVFSARRGAAIKELIASGEDVCRTTAEFPDERSIIGEALERLALALARVK